MEASLITNVRLDAYGIISRAVEEGIGYGYRRALKYSLDGEPSEEQMKDALHMAIMNSLCEVLQFDTAV